MKFIHKMFLLVVLLNFGSLMGQGKQEWKERSKQKGANFYEIRKEFSEKFKEKEEAIRSSKVQVISKSNNIKVIGENDEIKYKRWEWYMSQNTNPDGSFPSSTMLQKEFDNYIDKEQNQNLQNQKSKSLAATSVTTWENISRVSNVTSGYWGMGRTSSIGFHPTNSNIFWVCGQNGGVWKTIDGGNSYIAQGDDLPYLGAGSIVVDFSNPDILYVTAGDHTGGYGIGVYKSINGGDTWFPTDFTQNLSDQVQFYGMSQNSVQSRFLSVATSQGVYTTVNGGDTWHLVAAGDAKDVKYSNVDQELAFAVINNRVYKSTNFGGSYEEVNNSPAHSGTGRLAINGNNIVTWSSAGIWLSTDNGDTWVKKNNAREILDKNRSVNFESMTFSGDTLYGGEVNMYRSEDGGDTWSQISMWKCCSQFQEVHADHRYVTSHNGYIYSCNDGGVDSYNESNGQWINHSNGLIIPQYYSAASAETNGNIIGVGSQDNGGAARGTNLNWINTNGGDAGTQAIDPTDENIRYSNYNPNPDIIKTTNGWQSAIEVRPSDVNESWWTLPYVLDPNNSKRIVAGYHAVYTSDDRGENWKKISADFTTSDDYWGVLRSIAVAPSDSNVIYTARSRTFYYTYNNGKNWGTSSTSFTQDITSITVDPNNSKIVYITFGQYAGGNKVFKSINGGVSWTNISEGIPNIPVYSIVYQKDSNGLLYIGTQFGVFYKDNTTSTWQVYGEGLPKTMVRHVHINYDQRVLRAATYGRGIYEANLYGEDGLTCSKVKDVSVRNVTDTSISLSWSKATKKKYYYTFHRKVSDSEWIPSEVLLTTSTTIENLEPDTDYEISIGVACNSGAFEYVNVIIKTDEESNGLIDNAIYEIKSALSDGRSLTAFTRIETPGFEHNDNAVIFNDFNSTLGRWTLEPAASSGYYVLKSVADPTKALDIVSGSTAYGTNVQIWPYSPNNNAQEWKIEKAEGDFYKISPKNSSNMCLDVSSGLDKDLTNVQIWGDNGTIPQRWIFELEEGSTNQVAEKKTVNLQSTTLPVELQNSLAVTEKQIVYPVLPVAETLNVYPIPANESFAINFNQNLLKLEEISVELRNTLGSVVKKNDYNLLLENRAIDFNTSKLPVGMYVLLIKDTNGDLVHSQRILIRR